MQTKPETRNYIFNTIIDLVAVNFAFSLATYLSFSSIFSDRAASSEASYRTLLVLSNLIFLIINLFPGNIVHKPLRKFIFFVITYMSLIVFLKEYEFSRIFHLSFLCLFLVFTFLSKYINLYQQLEKFLFSNKLERKVVLISDKFDASVIEFINERPGNYRCVSFLSDAGNCPGGESKLDNGEIKNLEDFLSRESIDEVLISSTTLSLEKVEQIIKTTEKYHATISILPPYFQVLTRQDCSSEYWMGVPVISVCHSKLALKSFQVVKRLLDICVSSIFLTVVFPVLFLIVAPAIWLSNKGPIFFKQSRKGYKQEPFLCYKFRTMKLVTGINEVVQASRTDPRITAIGKSLRKTSLDEIPQFINVLFGNMSLVGPRPHMVEHDEMYEKFIFRYNVRFVTKPGITGWAQVNGLRGATEDPDLMQKRIEHDLWYIRNWSVWLDIKIIVLTAVKLLFKGDENAY